MRIDAILSRKAELREAPIFIPKLKASSSSALRRADPIIMLQYNNLPRSVYIVPSQYFKSRVFRNVLTPIHKPPWSFAFYSLPASC
jgi:hypothetical protein